MKLKTSELTGVALDWAVAKCLEPEDKRLTVIRREDYIGQPVQRETEPESYVYEWWSPSRIWAQGGPIIEREKLLPCYAPDGGDDPDQPWVCDDYAGQVPSGVYWGATFLIAAMRCYVASKLGDDIDVPEELK